MKKGVIIFYGGLIVYLIMILLMGIYDSHPALSKHSAPFISKDIYLHGDVTDQMAIAIGTAINEYNYEGANEIVMHITSPGGSVYAGLQIYDYMKQSKVKIRTVCEGYCFSMGAYLLAMGDIRQAYPHSSIMFHQVHSQSSGPLTELAADLAEATRLQNSMNEILHDRTGISFSQLKKIEDHDNYMSPDAAKDVGLIDSIIGE